MLRVYLFFASLLGLLLTACTPEPPEPTSPAVVAIIPKPLTLTQSEGYFRLNQKTTLVAPEAWQQLASRVGEQLRSQTSLPLASSTTATDAAIVLEQDANIKPAEAYQLEVTRTRITIKAAEPVGAFYGIQTLIQLLPAEAFGTDKPTTLFVPCVSITDAPRFAYRGMHLDVSRHFFPVEAIKKHLDVLAAHKQNYFHWHLTDDQGWRIEIKQYPKLTEVGGYRKETLIGHYNDEPQQFDGKRYGGFYTQDEVREVVRYAAERYITVVPEIEMPGHAQAAISAYPELACTPGPFEAATKWGVFEDVFCPKEETFVFLENVLKEVMALFPSSYIHIGGDECPKTRWEESDFCQQLMRKEGLKDEHELQSYFIRRIEKFLNANGRKLIGWDEILEGGLAPNALVMSWRGVEGGIAAAKSGHEVIMTPTSHCYFDYYQADHPDEPLAIGGLLPLEKVYGYEPVPAELTAEEARFILGAQGNVWTEYIPTTEQLHYMTWPRACAMAEIGWTAKDQRDYTDFAARMSQHIHRLQAWGIKAANHLHDLKTDVQSGDGQGVRVRLYADSPETPIYYTLDGQEPSAKATRYEKPIVVTADATIKAGGMASDKPIGRGGMLAFRWHKAAGKTISLLHPPHEKYSGNGPGSVINALDGSTERYGDAEWLGFEGQDFVATIDLGEVQDVQALSTRFYRGEGQWIYLPKSVKVSVSTDGKTYTQAAATTSIPAGAGNISELKLPLGTSQARYLRIEVARYGVIPAGQQGAGNEAWLFVDEIRID